MKRILKIGTGLVLVITLFQVFAQVSQIGGGRGNLLSPIVFSSTPRMNSQSTKLKANTPTKTDVLVEPTYGSYAKLISANPLPVRVFKPDGSEAQAGPDTFTKTESTQNNMMVNEIEFAVNADDGLWELEVTSTTDSLVAVISGNQTPGNTSIAVAVENPTPQVGDKIGCSLSPKTLIQTTAG